MNKLKLRALHRDLGYFYLGLIISFAISGIMMNHREHWHPEKYTVETKTVFINIPKNEDFTEKEVEIIGKKIGINDKFRRFKVKKDELRISFEKHDVEIDLKTGKTEIIFFKKTPIISQMMKLHKNNSNFWIYYSDIFGLSIITIAFSGAIIIGKGKFSFKNRGWKLALAGILFPLLCLFLF